MAIPRSRVRAKDRLIWAYTPRGLFTVNSANKVALSLSSHASPCTSSNAPNHTYYWSTIWGLSLPNKIKTFAWKASRNILPTKTNLCHRGILDEALCEACGLSEETSGHLFWDCTVAREIWEASGLPLDVRGIRYREFIDLIWHLIFVQHVGKELLELIVTIAWCMWYNRNKTRHGAPRQSSRDIIHKARLILEDYKLAHLQKPLHKEHADTRWIPPDYPWYMINVDAAVFSNKKAVGIGVVVREHEGSVLAALSKCIPLPLGPLAAEAKAMEEAAHFARDIGLQEVIFETDSSIISGALTGSSTAPVTVEDIIRGIQHTLRDFRRTQILHVRRQGNVPAHTLAQHAKGIDTLVWLKETPSCIENCVFQDALCLSHSE